MNKVMNIGVASVVALATVAAFSVSFVPTAFAGDAHENTVIISNKNSANVSNSVNLKADTGYNNADGGDGGYGGDGDDAGNGGNGGDARNKYGWGDANGGYGGHGGNGGHGGLGGHGGIGGLIYTGDAYAGSAIANTVNTNSIEVDVEGCGCGDKNIWESTSMSTWEAMSESEWMREYHRSSEWLKTHWSSLYEEATNAHDRGHEYFFYDGNSWSVSDVEEAYEEFFTDEEHSYEGGSESEYETASQALHEYSETVVPTRNKVEIENENEADVENDVEADAETGDNSADGGDAEEGGSAGQGGDGGDGGKAKVKGQSLYNHYFPLMSYDDEEEEDYGYGYYYPYFGAGDANGGAGGNAGHGGNGGNGGHGALGGVIETGHSLVESAIANVVNSTVLRTRIGGGMLYY